MARKRPAAPASARPRAGSAPPRAADKQFDKPLHVFLMLMWVGWAATQQQAGKHPKNGTAFARLPLRGSGLGGILCIPPSSHWVQREAAGGMIPIKQQCHEPGLSPAAPRLCGAISIPTKPCSDPNGSTFQPEASRGYLPRKKPKEQTS